MFAVDRISGQTGWHRRVSYSCLRSNIDMQLKVWVANLMAELRVVQSTDGFPMNIVIIVKDLTANISIYMQYRLRLLICSNYHRVIII